MELAEPVSAYQYYEFLAVDRPLDDLQQAEVRALSTRAHITATAFTNEYHWGDFSGDPSRLMERYYDAHLYFAEWGTRRIMLRLPHAVLPLKAARPYCVDEQVSAWTRGSHLILDLTNEAEDEYWENHSLSAVAGIRAELCAGDRRPLYLAWLSAYGSWERDEDAFGDEAEDELEPPVPAGLGSLTAPQRALADFLRLDDDLLAVAAQGAPPESDDGLADGIAALPAAMKDGLLLRVARGQAAQVGAELQRRFRRADDGPRRTVGALLDAAAVRRAERAKAAAAALAEEEARLERKRVQARQQRLDELARDEERAWARVEAMIDTKKAGEYDRAVVLLKDLETVACRANRRGEFAERVGRLRDRHLRKTSLLQRFARAGLSPD